jgi:hypothetical protein
MGLQVLCGDSLVAFCRVRDGDDAVLLGEEVDSLADALGGGQLYRSPLFRVLLPSYGCEPRYCHVVGEKLAHG